MAKNVVIVESPAKAKTINKYLGSDFEVLASYGHIRDLPSKNGSVDPSNSFSMTWDMDARSDQHVKSIQKAIKGANVLYLATDPDREGEAISWHVEQVLKERKTLDKIEVKRIVFHEITKTAIKDALAKARSIDQNLVSAYLARRALDYLVGFTLSPVLWRKLPGARSAGRVQSVALRLVVEREQEIERFNPVEYWSVSGAFNTAKNEDFEARLTYFDGNKLDKFDIKNEQQALSIVKKLELETYHVEKIDSKQVKRNPSPPFTTSTLQQEASRKLGFSASRTMQIAQRLYEGVEINGETLGLISYMRTDSVNLADEAVKNIRQHIQKAYGKEYLPSEGRVYKSKIKNAQEAHEAIRPTHIELAPQDVASYLDPYQLKLYELIWKRTMACQMEQAIFNQVAIDIISDNKSYTFRANGSTLVFDGFLKAYKEGSDDSDIQDDENRLLPVMSENEVSILTKVDSAQHFTQPPPRFTEASIVKKLEELGIGRPSTYASIIQVLQDRDYVILEKRQLIPQDRGRLVTSFLTNFFKQYVEYDFTAHMEEELDEISNGKRSWIEVLNIFWAGFHKAIEDAAPLRITEVLEKVEQDLSLYLFHGVPKEERICPSCKTGHINLKLGKFGAFLGCSLYPECRFTKQLGNSSDAEGENAEPIDQEPRIIGNDPNTNSPISVRKGPYGYYLQWEGESQPSKKKGAKDKPKRASIPPMIAPDEVDMKLALKLASLPFTLGIDPVSNTPVQVGVGRFGPYVKYDKVFASIPKNCNFLTITFDEAMDLIQKKQSSGGKVSKKKVAPKKTTSAKSKKK